MISLERAEELLQSSDFTGALAALGGACPAALQPQKDFLEAEARRGQGFFRRAETLYRKIFTARVRAQDPVLWIESGLSLAACRRSLGAVGEARRYLGAVDRLVSRPAWRSFRPRFAIETALVDRAAGAYGRSVVALRKALAGQLRGRQWADAAFSLWAIGGALRFAGKLEESRRTFERSRVFARRADDVQGQAYALFGLGGVTRIMGRLEDSVRYYTLAGRQLASTQDQFGKAYAECGLANALRQLGRWRDAQRHYLRSHALYSGLEDEVDLAYVEWGLGKIHLGQGELGKAIPRLRRSWILFERHSEARGEVLAGVALAQALHASGRTVEAENRFAAAYALAERSGLHAHLEIFT